MQRLLAAFTQLGAFQPVGDHEVSLKYDRPVHGGTKHETYEGPIKLLDSGMVALVDDDRLVPTARVHYIDMEDDDD